MATALNSLDIGTARVFVPLLQPSRYKAAFGGRGSGKSHFFAELAVERCVMVPGTRVVCVREVQKSLKESVKRLIEDKIGAHRLGGMFDPKVDEIRTPGGGVILFQGMQDHTAESIKSLEGFDIAYVEESQTLTERSLEMLRPTIRKSGSELWFSWNPRSKRDPVDAFFRSRTPPGNAVVVRANYDTNPFFPAELEAERLDDLENKPDRYAHIWLGDYEPAAIGAYYAREMTAALAQKRITSVPHYPEIRVETWWDLGIGDATAIWFAQRVGQEIHLIDYHEENGQSLAHYAGVLQRKQQENHWVYGDHVWPHDGGHDQLATGESLATTFGKLGFSPYVLERTDIGPGIDNVRNMLARCWFDEHKCERGIEALRNYRPEYDDDKQTFKPKPLHDWASHGSDAFRYGCQHIPTGDWSKPLNYDYGAIV